METKDILLGEWEGGANDGSGLRTMMFNYGLIFQKNGKGIVYSWERIKDGYDEDKQVFNWRRINENTIQLRYIDEENDSWEEVEYELSEFIGAYNSEWLKIINKGQEVFWDFPEPLYKQKIKQDVSLWKKVILFAKKKLKRKN